MLRVCSLVGVVAAIVLVLATLYAGDAHATTQGLSLRSGPHPSTLLLTADPTGGEVALTGINATVRISCPGSCGAIAGDGSASLTISPAGASEVTLTLAPLAIGQSAGVRATQGGSTVQVSLSMSQNSRQTTGPGTSAFASPMDTDARAPLRPGGFSLFVFAGGGIDSLLRAVSCGGLAPTFWAVGDDGEFLAFVPATVIAAVNEPFLRAFPNGLPPSVPLIARCG